MDIIFSCAKCKQELIVDAGGAGSEIECPSCKTSLVIPEADVANVRTQAPIASSAAAKEEHHFTVPQHQGPVEPLIKAALTPLEVVKDGERKIHIKTIRRSECVEVGKDMFDRKATEFLQKIGEKNILSIHTIHYSHQDMATKAMISDYGILVIFKG